MTLRLLALTCLLTPAALHAESHTAWPDAPKAEKHVLHHTVNVVTLDQPGTRQPCYVAAIDATALTCDSPTSSGRVLYPRSNIAAILETYKPFWTAGNTVAVILTGSAITLLVVNPLLAIVNGFIVGTVYLAMETNPFRMRRAPRDPYRERVLYQRHATTLSVDLNDEPAGG